MTMRTGDVAAPPAPPPSSQTTTTASTSALPGTDPPSPSRTGSSPGSTSKPTHRFKVVLIGDAGVGKTSLRQRWLAKTFSISYRATIGVDFISKSIELDHGAKVSLSVWDTAGQDRFRSLAQSFFRGADACVLVYSDLESLRSLESWYDEFKTKAPVDDEQTFTWCAVRTKIDLEHEEVDRIGHGEEEELFCKLLGRTQAEVRGYTVGDEASTSRNDDVPSSKPIASTSEDTTANKSREPIVCCSDMPTRIDVLPAPTSPTRTHGPNGAIHPRQVRTSTSFNTFKTTRTIYHTPSSSFHDSLASLTSGTNTIIPGSSTTRPPTRNHPPRSPSCSSSLSDDLEDEPLTPPPHTMEQVDQAELERERERGIDVFMSTSPPHPPPHLVTIGKYLGGPSTFQKDEKGRLQEEERKRIEVKMDRVPGGDQGERIIEVGYDYAQDGVKIFRTSAKTGEGVEDVFEYIAKRATWKLHKDEQENTSRDEAVGEVIRLGPERKGGKWREACCS